MDIQVIQKPTHVIYICDHCEEEIKIKYEDFTDLVGEPCDWSYEEVICDKCFKPNNIESWEFL